MNDLRQIPLLPGHEAAPARPVTLVSLVIATGYLLLFLL